MEQLFADPSTAPEGIKQTLAMLEQQRQAEQAQRNLAQQQGVIGQLTGEKPELAALGQFATTPGLAEKAIPALIAAITPGQEKPTTLQQNLAAFGVDLNTPEGKKLALGILQKPAVQINQAPDLPANFMWEDPLKKTGVMPIPGGPADPDVKSLQDRTKKLKESQSKIGQVEQSVGNYKDLLLRQGTKLTPGTEKARLGTAYTDLLLELKELYNLGVLQGPDLQLMQQVIKDPTSIEGNWLEFIGGKDALESQLEIVFKKIESAKQRAEDIYGGGLKPATPTGKVRKYNPATGRLE